MVMPAEAATLTVPSARDRAHVPRVVSALRIVDANSDTPPEPFALDGRDLPVLGEVSAVTIAATFPAGSALHVSHVRSWAGTVLADQWGEDDAFLAEVALSEVITNASVHTFGTVRFSLVVGEHEFVADVADESPALPTIRRAEKNDISGRGLEMIINLGGELAVFGGTVGKLVRLRFARQRPEPANPIALWAGDDD